MTKDEQIAILKSQKKGLQAATTFEDFKAQQIAYVTFLIEQFERDRENDEHIYNWVVRTEQ